MQSTGAKETPIRILLATADPVLRQTRRALLESFGFEVVVSDTEAHALELLHADAFRILVLGHTLTSEVCCKVASAFRARHPHGRIIEIAQRADDPPLNSPDASVVGMDGPIALRNAIENQLLLASGD